MFEAIRNLDQHDKNFELKKNTLFGAANQLRYITERQLEQLAHFLSNIKDNMIDAKYMKAIASVNKPNKESVKYGQAFVSLRKSFLNMAVKHASDKSKEVGTFGTSGQDDSGGEQS